MHNCLWCGKTILYSKRYFLKEDILWHKKVVENNNKKEENRLFKQPSTCLQNECQYLTKMIKKMQTIIVVSSVVLEETSESIYLFLH